MKGPSFQFYASDWLAETASWTLLAKGAHISLLAASWVTGELPNDESARARLVGASPKTFRKVWAEIGGRWVPTASGFVNPKLEEYRATNSAWRALQAAKGKAGSARRWNSRVGGDHGHNSGDGPDMSDSFPKASSSSSSPSPRDKHQDQDQALPFRILSKLAWDTFEEGNHAEVDAAFKEDFKCAIAKLGHPYDADLVQKVLDSFENRLRNRREVNVVKGNHNGR